MKKLKPLTDMKHLATPAVMQKVAEAEAKLGELRGTVQIIPNERILFNTLALQEAKSSSAIEQIVTTDDELYRSQLDTKVNGVTKEVNAHRDALLWGFEEVHNDQMMIRRKTLEALQTRLIGNDAGIRTQEGTVLKNGTGAVVYTPPPPDDIPVLLDNLMQFINEDDFSPLNPLIKMAIIHHQFERIHPFYDGNGRTGRMLNLLYLRRCGKLNQPMLYLSRYIIATKSDYYRLLQTVRDDQVWEEWILYILEGILQISGQTVDLIHQIKTLLNAFKTAIRESYPRLYSHDLINAIFKQPYTKIEFVQQELNCSYLTARSKLEKLHQLKLLEKMRYGRESYYLNIRLIECLRDAHHD